MRGFILAVVRSSAKRQPCPTMGHEQNHESFSLHLPGKPPGIRLRQRPGTRGRFVTEWPMSSTKVQTFRLREQLEAELEARRMP
jgi:hypothetical protein